VARLAGVPEGVIERAREILHTLEGSRAAESRIIEHLAEPAPAPTMGPTAGGGGATPPDPRVAAIAERIRALDVGRTTPLEALTLLDALQRSLRG
jgi:DNA mismatch repair protein MutS